MYWGGGGGGGIGPCSPIRGLETYPGHEPHPHVGVVKVLHASPTAYLCMMTTAGEKLKKYLGVVVITLITPPPPPPSVHSLP